MNSSSRASRNPAESFYGSDAMSLSAGSTLAIRTKSRSRCRIGKSNSMAVAAIRQSLLLRGVIPASLHRT